MDDTCKKKKKTNNYIVIIFKNIFICLIRKRNLLEFGKTHTVFHKLKMLSRISLQILCSEGKDNIHITIMYNVNKVYMIHIVTFWWMLGILSIYCLLIGDFGSIASMLAFPS